MRLVADIGGTNSRLAFAENGQVLPDTVRSFANKDHDSLQTVIALFLGQEKPSALTGLVAAVAGPVASGQAQLTNRNWRFSETDLATAFDLPQVRLINDLSALGYAAPALRPDQLIELVPSRTPKGEPAQMLVAGIATGFNVSPVLQLGGQTLCTCAEAGHASLPSAVAQAIETCQPGLSAQFPTVEDCFSGRGFGRFVGTLSGQPKDNPAEYTALYGQDGPVTEAINQYAALIGWLTRDLYLNYLPKAGLFFAGSVARAVLLSDAITHFHAVLAQPSFSDTLQFEPIWVINEDAAALTGCATVPL